MACLKCGRETGEGDVFCQDCLITMQRYPVRPGTAVVLPKRKATPPPKPKKAAKKKGPTPEERIKSLRLRVFLLSLALLLSLAVIGLLAEPAWRTYQRRQLRPGQNYSAVIATTAETTVETAVETTAATEETTEPAAP